MRCVSCSGSLRLTGSKFTGEFPKCKLHLLMLPNGLGGVPLQDLIGLCDARGNSTLCRHFGAVGHFYVAVDAHLSSNHATRPDGGGASDARLCGNDRVVSNLNVVCHLDEVVQFHALTQHGGPECRSIDVGARTNFTSIAQHDIPQLRNFFEACISWGKSKSVCTYGGPQL